MSDKSRIRVMIVDDHQVVREGFTVFLKAFDDLEFVGSAINGEEAVQLCAELQPHVILMDMMMPQMDGITAIQLIRAQHPDVQILALTSFTDNNELVPKAIEAGAIGYLFKDVSIDELAKAIRSAAENTPYLTTAATRMLIDATKRRSADDFNLSQRELEVLTLLVEGLNNRQVAERLTLSQSTVKFHVSSILGKLGATSRTEAVSLAHQHKLVN